ncbi:hypothetical protein CHELA20_52313 [Hyphomicrobiales bacterium]|nr:hypothetical protein CHELA41_22610 [Hyphomicrobiales bacterium]CAH1681516.1 hypothetical protein CHELA20_52313 [Hyphomicrobiales bacterium]
MIDMRLKYNNKLHYYNLYSEYYK